MFKRLLLSLLLPFLMFLHGCASVPMASQDLDAKAKQFAAKSDKANIYVYRNETLGAAIKMDVAMDGRLLGQTVANSYLMVEVLPGKHTFLSTAENESLLDVSAEAGRNYFIWQEVKMGLMYARNKLQLMDEATGMKDIQECKLIEMAR